MWRGGRRHISDALRRVLSSFNHLLWTLCLGGELVSSWTVHTAMLADA